MIDTIKPEPQADRWQRLSPVAMIHYMVMFLTVVIRHGTQTIIPLAAVFLATGESRWFIISLIAISAIAFLIAAALLSYIKFRYQITGDTVLIHSGVLKQKKLSLGFNRIQNVALNEPIYFRPFNTVTLTIESAGSTASEVKLAGLPRALAESIRSKLLKKRDTEKTRTTSETPANAYRKAEEQDDLLLKQPITELARHGLISNNTWLFAGLIAGITTQFDLWEYINPFDLITLFNEGKELNHIFAGLIAFIGMILFIAVMTGASIAASVISYYKYTLTYFRDGRFQRKKGLFEKQETSLRQSKIQSLIIKQPWSARLLNRFNLELRQAGSSQNGTNEDQTTDTKFLVPSTTTSFLNRFVGLLYPSFNWKNLPLNPISVRYTYKIIFHLILPISLLPTIPLTYIHGLVGLLPLLAPLLILPIINQYRRMYGYATDNHHGIVQTGFLGTRRTIFPFFKVQTIELIQSPGQRKHKLATLRIHMAGTNIVIPYIPLADAQEWRRNILLQVETSNKSWM